MAASRNRVGGAYALTTFAPILPGHDGRAAGLHRRPAGGRREPAGAPGPRCTSRASRSSTTLVHQGDKHDSPTACESQLPRVHEQLRRRARPLPRRDLRTDRCRRRTRGGGTASAIPGRADRAAFSATSRPTRSHTQPVRRRRTRRATVAKVREALALREQLVDFAADAQGLDAAALQERFLATFAKAGADGAPPPAGHRPALQAAGQPARRRSEAADIDRADIQGNVLRGYTYPVRRVPVPAHRRRRPGARADERAC